MPCLVSVLQSSQHERRKVGVVMWEHAAPAAGSWVCQPDRTQQHSCDACRQGVPLRNQEHVKLSAVQEQGCERSRCRAQSRDVWPVFRVSCSASFVGLRFAVESAFRRGPCRAHGAPKNTPSAGARQPFVLLGPCMRAAGILLQSAMVCSVPSRQSGRRCEPRRCQTQTSRAVSCLDRRWMQRMRRQQVSRRSLCSPPHYAFQTSPLCRHASVVLLVTTYARGDSESQQSGGPVAFTVACHTLWPSLVSRTSQNNTCEPVSPCNAVAHVPSLPRSLDSSDSLGSHDAHLPTLVILSRPVVMQV